MKININEEEGISNLLDTPDKENTLFFCHGTNMETVTITANDNLDIWINGKQILKEGIRMPCKERR